MTRMTISIGTIAAFAISVSAALLISGCATHTPTVGPGKAAPFGSEPLGIAAEELWVIALPETGASLPQTGRDTGGGQLYAGAAEGELPLPLKELNAHAALNGCLATIELEQRFENKARTAISGEYILPLAGGATVRDFVMTIGKRKIRGVVRERAEAERFYREAAGQGYLTSLLLAELGGSFRVKIGNIEPGHEIGVRLKYFQTLLYLDGWQEFVFHLPGQNVAQFDSPPSSPKISLQVDINSAVKADDVVCDTHKIVKQASGPENFSVSLAPEQRVSRSDFVLRYRQAREEASANLLVHREGNDGYFALIAYPPAKLAQQQRPPLELCFVVDDSKWMAGQPLAQARDAVRAALRALQPEDSFTILTLAGKQAPLAAGPITASTENIQKGIDYVEKLNAIEPNPAFAGLETALKFPPDAKRARMVCCLSTGRNGPDTALVRALHADAQKARVYWVGLGETANRPLLNMLARMGNSAVTYIGPKDDAGKLMTAFLDRICHPVLSDIHVDWSGLKVSEVFPQRIPDLLVGRPILLTGRFNGAMPSAIRLVGKTCSDAAEFSLPVKVAELAAGDDTIAGLWATAKIRSLLDRAISEPDGNVRDAIRKVALDFGLASPLTAYVAVDATRKTSAGEGPPISNQQTNAKEK